MRDTKVHGISGNQGSALSESRKCAFCIAPRDVLPAHSYAVLRMT